MKLLLAAGVVLAALGLASAAAAADLPARSPAPAKTVAVPALDWTGAYVGIQGGAAWGSSTHNFPGGTHSPFNLSGGAAGGTFGYNWQRGNVLAGLEGDLAWSSLSGSTIGSPTLCTGGPCTSRLTWLGTVRGRLGYAVDKWTAFVTGGIAFGNVNACENLTCSSENHTGWTVGGGLEAMLTTKWSAKVEYLYANLGRANAYTFVALHTETTSVSILRAGLNFKL